MTTTTNTNPTTDVASNMKALAWSLNGFLTNHGAKANKEVRNGVELLAEMAKLTATGLLLDGSLDATDLRYSAAVLAVWGANAGARKPFGDHDTEALARRSVTVLLATANRLEGEVA